MLELFEWELNSTIVAGTFLWSLGLYIGLDKFRESLLDGLESWLGKFFQAKSGAKSANRSEDSDSPQEILASLISILPFIIIGICCHFFMEIGLGQGWSISTGILAVISCSVYDLGRKDSRRLEDEE